MIFKRKVGFIKIWFYLSSICFVGYDGARILGVTFIATNSHQNFFNSIWRELSLRGHEVTSMTAIPLRDKTLRNLTEIDVSDLFEIFKKQDLSKHFSVDNNFWDTVIFSKYMMQDFVDALLNIAKVKELINSDAKFDLVIAEVHDAVVYAFGERFKAPVIGKYL